MLGVIVIQPLFAHHNPIAWSGPVDYLHYVVIVLISRYIVGRDSSLLQKQIFIFPALPVEFREMLNIHIPLISLICNFRIFYGYRLLVSNIRAQFNLDQRTHSWRQAAPALNLIQIQSYAFLPGLARISVFILPFFSDLVAQLIFNLIDHLIDITPRCNLNFRYGRSILHLPVSLFQRECVVLLEKICSPLSLVYAGLHPSIFQLFSLGIVLIHKRAGLHGIHILRHKVFRICPGNRISLRVFIVFPLFLAALYAVLQGKFNVDIRQLCLERSGLPHLGRLRADRSRNPVGQNSSIVQIRVPRIPFPVTVSLHNVVGHIAILPYASKDLLIAVRRCVVLPCGVKIFAQDIDILVALIVIFGQISQYRRIVIVNFIFRFTRPNSKRNQFSRFRVTHLGSRGVALPLPETPKLKCSCGTGCIFSFIQPYLLS